MSPFAGEKLVLENRVQGYELENGLTRAQGTTLLVRMIGMEETAENGKYEVHFTDVPNWNWAFHYIGYAYENGKNILTMAKKI